MSPSISQLAFKPTTGPAVNLAELKRPIRPLALQPDQFSSIAVSEPQQLHQTTLDALALFQQHNSRDALLTAAKQMGLEVYDGSQHAWVDAYCLKEGVEAFVYTPFTKRYPDIAATEETKKVSSKTSAPWYDFITNTLNKKWSKVEADLASQKKAGLFFKKNASPDVLMHELFHVLQEKNGLLFGVNPEADAKANVFSNELNQPTFSSIMKRAGLLVLVALNSLVKPLQEPKTDVAKSLYRQMQREVEVDKFMMNYGHLIGVSPLQQLKHVVHYFVESQFKLRLSNLMDQPTFNLQLN